MMNEEEKNIDAELEEDSLHEHFKFEATKGQSPLRVDKFLMNYIENATRNKIQQAATNGNIFVNDGNGNEIYKKQIEYTYDDNKNWISKKTTLNNLVLYTSRKIEYY